VHQLYIDGATSAEITAMLAIEANATALHNQIQAEAATDPTLVNQLYTDLLSSAKITAWLAIQSNANAIHLFVVGLGGAVNLLENPQNGAALLNASEGVANQIGGGNGHARARHVQATAQIYVDGFPNNDPEQTKTVYNTIADQNNAGNAALNSPAVQTVHLRTLDINPALVRQTITVASPVNNVTTVRGPNAAGIARAPVAIVRPNVRMIVERTPAHGLHIVTCYPTN
jgi:hypothetical protein